MWQKIETSNHTSKLVGEFTFKNFKEAFAFMTEVAFEAELSEHHPNWKNVWNQVETELTTHDKGNQVTERDEKLAEIINQIYTKYNGKNS